MSITNSIVNIQDINDIIEELKRYYLTASNFDIVTGASSNLQDKIKKIRETEDIGDNDKQIKKALELMMSINKEYLTTTEIVKEFNNRLGPQVQDLVRLYYEDNLVPRSGGLLVPETSAGDVTIRTNISDIISATLTQSEARAGSESDASGEQVISAGLLVNKGKKPDRYTDPHLSAFCVSNGEGTTDNTISFATRGADAVSIFCNLIPPLEMSRCVPHINAYVLTDGPTPEHSISAARHLSGRNFKSDSFAMMLTSAKPLTLGEFIKTKVRETETNSTVYKSKVAGMELFTSPQVMSNPEINKNSDGNRVEAFNPMAPFLSLGDISLSVQSSRQGALSYLTGNMKLTLHDRARLDLIAPLVSTAFFGETRIVLEFGWNHPDSGDFTSNSIGKFLNALKVRKHFRVATANYTFTEDGQVDITLSLTEDGSLGKGGNSSRVTIAAGRLLDMENFEEIVDRVIRIKNAEINDKKIKDVLGTPKSFKTNIANKNDMIDPNLVIPSYGLTLMEAADKIIRSEASVFRKVNTELIDAFLETVKNSFEASRKSDRTVVNAAGIETVDKSVGSSNREVERKRRELDDISRDPFLHEINIATNIQKGTTIPLNFYTGEYVSLGRVLLLYVGLPLATSRKHDEVQFIFHKANETAAACHGEPLSDIPILKKSIDAILERRSEKTSNKNMSITEFVEELSKELHSKEQPCYGVTDLYRFKDQDEISSKNPGEKSSTDKTINNSDLSSKLVRMYDSKATKVEFKPIRLKMYTESNPTIKRIAGKSVTLNILKVHIVDTNYTPYGGESLLLEGMRDSKNVEFVLGKSGNKKDRTSKLIQKFTKKSGAKIKKSPGEDSISTLVSRLPAADVLNMMKSTVPTISYGQSVSNVTSLRFNGNIAGDIANAQIYTAMKQVRTNDELDLSTDNENIILAPGKLSLTMLGMPFMTYAQQFFVESNTKTSLDGIYLVTALSHTISAGNFTTTAELSPIDFGSMKVMRSKLVTAINSGKIL